MIKSKTKYESTPEEIRELFNTHKIGAVADFITLGPGQKSPLSSKEKELEIYNETADEKIVLSDETEIRYELAVCYLALIEEVEKYVRYEPDEPNYIRNTKDARIMYDLAFDIL